MKKNKKKETRGRKKLPESELIIPLRISAKKKDVATKGGVIEAQKTLQLFWNEHFNTN